jgi:hypothetical protein
MSKTLYILLCCLCFHVTASCQNREAKGLSPTDTTSFLMQEGCFMGFFQVNLSMGEIGFQVWYTSNLPQKQRVTLEFRIGQPKGKKSKRIGKLRIPNSADTLATLKLEGHLRHAIGIHDLFLVPKGVGSFQLKGISFIPNYYRWD